MWLALAFVSAALLGFYDTSKKASLKDNAVLPVLLLNTIFSTLIFSPSSSTPSGASGGSAGLSLIRHHSGVPHNQLTISQLMNLLAVSVMRDKASTP